MSFKSLYRPARGLVALPLLILPLLIVGCGHQSEPTTTAIPVRAATVEGFAADNGVHFSASIVPQSQVELAFKSSGYVDHILQVKGPDGKVRDVTEGDWVEKGTVLASVRADEYRNRVEQANQQITRAEAENYDARQTFDRAQALYQSQSLTKPDYDQAKSRFDSTTAALAQAKADQANAQISLEDCRLRAPTGAWVLKRNVAVGSLVGAATVGFELADTRSVKVIFGVPDTMLGQVRAGSRQVITTDALAGTFEGRITAISAAADRNTRVYSVEVTIPNPKNSLRSGMIASLQMKGQPFQAIQAVPVIPLNAIVKPTGSGAYSVFVLPGTSPDARAELRSVELGEMRGNFIAVVKGLRPGERIVTTGSTMLREGDAVQVLP